MEEYHDNFDFIEVLKEELERDQSFLARMRKDDDDENDQDRFEREIEERQKRVQEDVKKLTNKRELEEMPQMTFRRLLNDEDVLNELTKYILDCIYRSDMGEGNVKTGELKDLLKTIDKTLYLQLLDSRLGGRHRMTYD